MLKQLYPYEYADSVFTIDYQKLYDKGFKAVIFDIDNTLVHHGDDSTAQVDHLFEVIHNIGLKTLLLSNNEEKRILRFLRNIDSLYINDAGKPNVAGYLKAVEMLGVKKTEVVFIGDQLFTDILGANRSGMANILVKFIRLPEEKRIGKRRWVELAILKVYKLRKRYCHRLGDILKEEVI